MVDPTTLFLAWMWKFSLFACLLLVGLRWLSRRKKSRQLSQIQRKHDPIPGLRTLRSSRVAASE